MCHKTIIDNCSFAVDKQVVISKELDRKLGNGSSYTGAVVGGVTGGVIILIIVVVIFVRRRILRNRHEKFVRVRQI